MTNINIRGPLIQNGDKWIYDLFGIDATCPKDVIESLPDNSSDITVMINSGGGYVHVGNEIYTALAAYPGKVTVDVIMAGSAASVIATAGRPTRISPVGQIMIHNVSTGAEGDYRAMEHASEVLQKANKSIAAAYRLKTGLSEEELLSLMDAETWMTAEEAKEKGFADEILFQNSEVKLVANSEDMLPEKIIAKMQNLKTDSIDTDKLVDAVAEKVFEQLKNQSIENKSKQEPEAKASRFFIY